MPLEITSFIPPHVMAHLPSPVKQVIDYSQSTLTGLEREVERVRTKATDIFQAFQRSPLEGAQRVWTQLTQNPENVSSSIGLASNVVTLAGVILGNPILITVSLIGSSVAHVVSSDAIQQKEELKKRNEALEREKRALEIANANLRSFVADLNKTNAALEAQVRNLRSEVLSLKQENEKLAASNAELKRSISDLQSTVRSLQSCLSVLKEFNGSLQQELARLGKRIDEFKSENEKLGRKIDLIADIEKCLGSLRTTFDTFSRVFTEAKDLLSTQLGDISRQLSSLHETIHLVRERLPDLERIQELSLVHGQFTLALKGIEQYQHQLNSTNAELETTRKKNAEEQIKMEASRKAFEALLKRFEQVYPTPILAAKSIPAAALRPPRRA